MSEAIEPEKAGRVKISFYLPDYVYDNFVKRLDMGEVADKQITTGAVNAVVKVFALEFARGNASLSLSFEPKKEELKKAG